MINLNFKIKRVTVLLTNSTDIINIYPYLESPFQETKYDATFKMEAKHNYGVEYCQKVLGVDPEVIDARINKE